MKDFSITDVIHSIGSVGLDETVRSYGLEEYREIFAQLQAEHYHLDMLDKAVHDCWKRIYEMEGLLMVRGVGR
jgi:hypothetical protein